MTPAVAPAVVRVRAFLIPEGGAQADQPEATRPECERAYSSLDSRAVCGPEAPFKQTFRCRRERGYMAQPEPILSQSALSLVAYLLR